jgi:phosphoadenosine phosphosulfate reductase
MALPNGYVIFSKPNCKDCKAAKALLRKSDFDFEERDASDDAVRGDMLRRAPDANRVPQIFLNSKHVGGFQELSAKLKDEQTWQEGPEQHKVQLRCHDNVRQFRNGRSLPGMAPTKSMASAHPSAPPSAVERHSEALIHALEGFSEEFNAEDVVAWAAETFGEGLVLQTSAGTQAAVMLNLVARVVPNVKVVFVDTGYLPTETVEYMEILRDALNLNLTVAKPKLSPSELVAQYGKLWETDHELYGQITKVEPMNRALKELGATAILSGIRAGQTDTRAGLTKVCFDMGSHLFKVLPILDWDKADVKSYFKDNMLPRHPLESRGFATVGDAHSSRAMKPGETNERVSRFGGKSQECGLHTQTVSVKQLLVQWKQPQMALPDGYVIFSKPNCKNCKAAKALLRKFDLDFEERDVSDDAVRGDMQRRAPGSTKVPQIFLNNDHLFGGFEELFDSFSIECSLEAFVASLEQHSLKAADEVGGTVSDVETEAGTEFSSMSSDGSSLLSAAVGSPPLRVF